jgi:glycosyltransferase involved in cell wall biosynthesis
MRIAQIVSLIESVPPKGKNGLEFLVSWLTEELVRRGHDVTLFAPADSKTKAKLVSICPQALSRDPNSLIPPNIYDYWNIIYAMKFADQFDVIHAHSLAPAYFRQICKTPLVRTSHHPISKQWLAHYNDPFYHKYLKKLEDIKEDGYKVFVSQSQKKASFSKQQKSFTVYNGIPIDNFKFNPNPKDYFAFFGFLNYDKGAHIAVQVARKAGVKLLLAGVVKKEEDFFDKEIKPHLNKKIQYIGPITNYKDKSDFLGNAKGLLVPIQWEEPFGLVMPEAMACGTPPIAFRRGAIPEIIENKKNGFIVNSEKQMIEAIKNIDKIDRRQCRKRVEKDFTIEKMVDRYEEVYRKIVGKK